VDQTYFTEFHDLDSEYSTDSHLIRNVLLCGNSSRNGYEIPPEAFGDVQKLYGGLPIFLDHSSDPNKPLNRSVKDIAGFIVEAKLRYGKPYGTIDTSELPGGPHLLALARKKLPGVGLSHVASYKLDKSKRTVLKVERVYSVDAVVRPATTSTFYEGATDRLILEHELEGMRVRLGLAHEECDKLRAQLNQAQYMARRTVEKLRGCQKTGSIKS